MSTANQSRLQLVWGIEALNLMFQLGTLNCGSKLIESSRDLI